MGFLSWEMVFLLHLATKVKALSTHLSVLVTELVLSAFCDTLVILSLNEIGTSTLRREAGFRHWP